jgi:hypothetical protein
MLSIFSTGREQELSELEKYIGSNSNPKFFFSMTQIDKLGINPHSKYSTPIGVYAYPLTKEYYTKLINETLPFAGDQPHIQLFTLNVPTFNLINYTEEQLLVNTKTIRKMYGPDNETIYKAFDTARSQSAISRFWNLTRLVSKTPTKWNALLRNLGYTNFYDPGEGVIYPSEPTQMVVLDPTIIIHLGSFSNQKDYDKYIKRNNNITKLFSDPKLHKYITPELLNNLSLNNLHSIWYTLQYGEHDLNILNIIAMMIVKKTYPDDNILKYIAISVNTSQDVLNELAKSLNASIRFQVANHPSTPVKTLIELSRDKDDAVRGAVASNYKTPPKILHELSIDISAYVRQIVADNPNTPKEILIELTKDINNNVSTVANFNLRKNFNINDMNKKSNKINDFIITACEIYEDILRIV